MPAGCSGGNSGATGGPPAATATDSPINALPAEKVQDGGKLTWPLRVLPANFNYFERDGTTAETAAIVSALMPVTYDVDATGRPVWNRTYLASEPKLATGAKQVVTYELNPKAVWSDGTPLTWEDFAGQWKALSGADKAYQVGQPGGYDNVESVQRGTGDREVVVTYKRRYADWTSLFNMIYPRSTTRDPKVFNDGWRDKPLVTAGPFRLDTVDPAAQTVTLVRNENWWGNRPKLDTIVFRVMESNAQIEALANGQVDFADLGSDLTRTNRAKTIGGVEIRRTGGANFRHLTINGTSPNLQDVKVRQALAMSIDRDAIGKALLDPLGYETRPLNNHIFMTNQDGYQDNAGELGTFTPDRARQVLDGAGWTLDGDVRHRGDRRLEINLVVPSGVAAAKQESELIQAMLGKVGFAVKINAVPAEQFFDKYIALGRYDITIFSWLGAAYPISSSRSIYASPKRGDKGELDVQRNYARIGSPEIDGLFDQAGQELDRRKATEIANKIDSLVWQEVHSVTIYQRPDQVACKKNLANFGAFGFASVDYTLIGWAR
jgi:peptide/nickel transport system substrate-binding protein